MWTNYERRQALDRAITQNGDEYILPVRLNNFNDQIPGLSEKIGYINVDYNEPDKVVKLFLEKIGTNNSLEREAADAEWILVLSGTLSDLNKSKAEAIVKLLRMILGDSDLTLVKFDKGSIRVHLKGNTHGLESALMLFKIGQLREIMDYNVSDIISVNRTIQKNFGDYTISALPQNHSGEKMRFYIERLQHPVTKLFGRNTVLKEISEILNNPTIGVLGIIADGGIGKTALLWNWLTQLDTAKFDLSHVFAWPFYDREKHENTTSDAFFTSVFEALEVEPSPADIRTADFRAKYLLAKYNATNKILVLDGLEVLQSQDEISFGEITDSGIRAFLENATYHKIQHDQRLILVTSRVSLTGLLNYPGYHEFTLDTLEPEDGKKLLSELKVVGDSEELEQASKENNGHCLCLVL